MPRALISVYDKTGVAEFAGALVNLGWDVVASGGTEIALTSAGVPCLPVEQLTGFADLLGGRVKTLHPAVQAGILARDREEDFEQLRAYGYAPIAMVVCNLYPFQQTIAQPGVTMQDALEQIDIGGVTLLRAAAKNFLRTCAVCDIADYPRVLEALHGQPDDLLALRRELAAKAFAHVRDYDTAVASYLSTSTSSSASAELPEELSIVLRRGPLLRYGENPHQQAAFYSRQQGGQPMGGDVLGGKDLSFNNIVDLDAAWRAVSAFQSPAVTIVKHANPCGIACSSDAVSAFTAALASDPVSAFGGVIALNVPVTDAFVTGLGSLFVEAIAAPDFEQEAAARLAQNRRNCRLVRVPTSSAADGLELRTVRGGYLLQQTDLGDPEHTPYRTVTKRQPTAEEVEQLRFAWKAVQHVKSNAIVLARGQATVGIGGGLPSRVDSVHLAVAKAGERAAGSVLASDAFFPFADGLLAACDAGVTAVIQPGGSVRDDEVVAAADERGIAMVFTGVRHFRH